MNSVIARQGLPACHDDEQSSIGTSNASAAGCRQLSASWFGRGTLADSYGCSYATGCSGGNEGLGGDAGYHATATAKNGSKAALRAQGFRQ